MNTQILVPLFIPVLVFIAVASPQFTNAAIAFSQSVTLQNGWNIISTPRILESHEFSAPETSANFDIFILDASKPAGWATMADLGQSEFTPLYGYFIKNKTGINQTLTFNYKAEVPPNERLFQRTFSATGWYSIGVANPSYAKSQSGSTSDINNVDSILNSLLGSFSYYGTVVDFTNAMFISDPNSVALSDPWKAVVRSPNVSNVTEINKLNDFRETKGYAIYIKQADALYSGFQNNDNSTFSLDSVSYAIGPQDPGSNQTKEVGATGYTFASVRWTAGSGEDLWFKSIRWNQVGSATNSDLTNVKVYVNDIAYDTVVSLDGKYYTATLPDNGVFVKKSESVETYVKGDVTGGSSRTIDFDIYRTTDVYFIGALSGYDVVPAAATSGRFSTGNPFFNGYVVTVSAGSLNMERDDSVVAQNITKNLSGQPLGGFTVEVKGEPVQTSSLAINFTITTAATRAGQDLGDLKNVAIYNESGSVIAGPKDGVSGDNSITFFDTITWPVGKFKYALKGKLGTDFVNNDTVQASTTPSSDWTSVGANTGTSITETPASAVTFSLMTLKAGSLTISTSPNPVAQNVIAGAQGFLFANYQFDASASGEDVRMASVPLSYGGTGTASNLTTCQLWDGAIALNSGSNVKNPTAFGSSTAFTFDGAGLTVTKGTIKTLALKCNIAASASGQFFWGSDDLATYTATGLTSGTTITPTAIDSNGQNMAVATAGTLTVSLNTSNPAYYIAAGGTNDNTLTTLKFHAANEAINLKKVAFNLSGVASNSPQDLVGEKVTLWDGATKVGEAIFTTQTPDYGTSTLTADFIIPKDGDKVMTVKGSFAAIGTSQPGTQGDLVIVDWDGAGRETEGTGVDSGSTIRTSAASSDTASNGVRIFKSYPTVSQITTTGSLVSGRRDLLKFKITASPQGDVGIAALTFTVATSSVTYSNDMIDGLNVYAYTDSGFSSVASGVQTDGAFIAINKDLTNVWKSSATELEFWAENASAASTTPNIPAGQSRWFVLRGDVTTAGATFSAATTLLGDSAYPITGNHTSPYLQMTTADELRTQTNNDLIWSPFATTTSIMVTGNGATPDFTNGFSVPGLPSFGFSQTLSQ